MELWYKQFGFHNNPFSIKPLAFHDEIMGYDVDLVLTKINNGEVLFLEGDYGKGKTTILKKIVRKFGGKKEVVYYSYNKADAGINFDKLISGRHGLFGGLFSNDTNLILLLDEAENLSLEDSENLVGRYQKNFKSIVLVGKDFNELGPVNGMQKLIGANIVRLGELTEDDAINIVRKRIGYINLLSDDIIKVIFKKSGRNPRNLLKNCEDVCRCAVEQGYRQVKEEHVKKVLG